MTLAKEVTKLFPTPNRIGMQLVLTDDSVEVLTKSYWKQFNPTGGATIKIKQKIAREMQADIDEYKRLRAIYDASAFDTAITQVSDGLNL